MNRIEDTLNQLKEKKEKAFITYVTAGYPDLAKTKEILKAQEAAGTDIVELGVPFSDPVADGPVIQDASYRSICGGTTLKKVFRTVEEARNDGLKLPIVFMLYYNTIVFYGVEAFVKECERVGVDGLIIPDLPMEEQEEIKAALDGQVLTIIAGLLMTITAATGISGVRRPHPADPGRCARICLLRIVDGCDRSGSAVPQRGQKLSEICKRTVQDPGYDGIWHPHRKRCGADEGIHRWSDRRITFYQTFGGKQF